jgi:tetratricopeptide (TPR) repeat protein
MVIPMTDYDNLAILRSFLAAGDGALKLGKYASAEHFYQESLRFANRHLGAAFPETALANFSLSMFYLDRQQLPEAATYANAALNIFIGIFGNDHPTTAMALHQLAEVCQAQNLSDIAKPMRQRAKNILAEHLLGLQRRLVTTTPDYSREAIMHRVRINRGTVAFQQSAQTDSPINSQN